MTKHLQANLLTVCSRMDVEVKHREAGVVGVNPSIPSIGIWNTTRFNNMASLLRANQRGANIYLIKRKMVRPPADCHCSNPAKFLRDSLAKRVLSKATKVNLSRSSS